MNQAPTIRATRLTPSLFPLEHMMEALYAWKKAPFGAGALIGGKPTMDGKSLHELDAKVKVRLMRLHGMILQKSRDAAVGRKNPLLRLRILWNIFMLRIAEAWNG